MTVCSDNPQHHRFDSWGISIERQMVKPLARRFKPISIFQYVDWDKRAKGKQVCSIYSVTPLHVLCSSVETVAITHTWPLCQCAICVTMREAPGPSAKELHDFYMKSCRKADCVQCVTGAEKQFFCAVVI